MSSCGTVAGASAHQRRGEQMCRACLDARKLWQRAARERWARERDRDNLLADLKTLNRNLRRLGIKPTYKMSAARLLSLDDLRDAVTMTGHALVREGRILHEVEG